jgi:hypothetical protein
MLSNHAITLCMCLWMSTACLALLLWAECAGKVSKSQEDLVRNLRTLAPELDEGRYKCMIYAACSPADRCYVVCTVHLVQAVRSLGSVCLQMLALHSCV